MVTTLLSHCHITEHAYIDHEGVYAKQGTVKPSLAAGVTVAEQPVRIMLYTYMYRQVYMRKYQSNMQI